MIRLIIGLAILTGVFRLMGRDTRMLGRILGWTVCAAVITGIIRGLAALTGYALELTVSAAPAILLVVLGILIGRRIRGRRNVVDDVRDHLRIDDVREHVPFEGFQSSSSREVEVIDRDGRVIG